MQNLRSFRALLIVAMTISCALTNRAAAQTHTPKYISTGANSQGFYEYLPQGYNPNGSETYPLIVAIHGVGECGTNLGNLLWSGVPSAINSGTFPVSLTVNGQTFKFIVISPQFINWPSIQDVDQVINYATSHYKVNLSRVYLTGLSMGGGIVWEYAGAGGNYTNRLAAIAPICGASWPEYTRARNIANGNLPVWAFHNDGDGTVPSGYTNDYISQINQAPAPNPNAKKTIFPTGGHDAWTNVYFSNYSEGGLTLYKWFLQFQKGTTPPAYNNQLPVVNAGPDQVVTPNSPVYLAGSGSDPDGNIVSYAWTKVSGPSSFIFSNLGIASPVLTGLTSGLYTFRLTVTDNLGATSSDDVVINVPMTIPARIEAENYSAMSGIQTENTWDAGGGSNVGWQDNGDWMDYPVFVPVAGNYTVNFRVAAVYNGPQFQLRKSDGSVLATVTVPSTNNVQNWTTVSAQVSLPAGQQTLRIVTTNAGGGWNFNWFEFLAATTSNQAPTVNAGAAQTITLPTSSVTLGGSASDVDGWISSLAWTQVSGPSNATIATPWTATTTVSGLVQGTYTFKLQSTDNSNANGSATVTVTVNAATGGSSNTGGSIKIEAESFTQMSGVQTENTQDAGGGLNVGWQDTGDWMDYAVNVSNSGSYTVNFRVASYFAGAQFQLKKSDGTVLATVTVPNTGTFQSWTTVAANVNLPAGQQTLRILTSNANGGWNFNWWEIAGATSAPTPTPTPNPNPNPSTSTVKIEAESFTQMSGIQTENTQDAGGGLNVGWQDNNDWMDYSVSMTSAGVYTTSFRVASFFSGAQFQVRNSSGAVLATVTVPNTGSFQTWQTVTANLNLAAGTQTLRIVTTAANGGWNFNWFEIAGSGGTATTTPPASTSVKIEAESFSQMSGVQTEGTQDIGGGLNVGWQDNNDWMDYSVNLANADTYMLNFRVASFFSGAQFQVRNSAGTVLATVTVPNTGGFQTWQTVSVSATLPAGQQTLRLFTSNANGGWNINWWEITSGTISGRGGNGAVAEEVVASTTAADAEGVQVYPNPVKDRFMLKLNNTLTGKMNVQVVDLKGSVVKQFSLNKANKGLTQSYLNIADLRTGQYILKITMADYSVTRSLIKQ